MFDQHQEQKAAGENGDYILIRVVGQDANEMHFRVKLSLQMGKVKESYCERLGVPVTSLRFIFNGQRINDDDTPKKINLKNDDVIYSENDEAKAPMDNCSQETSNYPLDIWSVIGRFSMNLQEPAEGCPARDSNALEKTKALQPPSYPEEKAHKYSFKELMATKGIGDYIVIRVQGEDTNEIHFRIKMCTQMGKLKEAFCQKRRVPVTSLQFIFNKQKINDDDTPKKINLRNGDVIHVFSNETLDRTDIQDLPTGYYPFDMCDWKKGK